MQRRGGRHTRLVKGTLIQQPQFKLDTAYVGKKYVETSFVPQRLFTNGSDGGFVRGISLQGRNL